MPADLSVIILNWNAKDYLLDSLHSITTQSWRHEIEVIVVDNASHLDDSVAAVKSTFPQIPLIENTTNIGFAAGNNVGWRKSTGRYVLFLNPDTIVHDGAFDLLIDWMDEHANERIGACGPKLLNSDGSLQLSCRAFPSFGAGIFRNTFLGRMFPNNPWSKNYMMSDFAHDKAGAVDWLSGSALMLRRDALEEMQGWSEKYFMYCEDVDLCYRLKLAKWERWYVPCAVITHRIGGSSDWAQGAMIRQHHSAMLRFYLTHYTKGLGWILAPVAVLGIGLRAAAAVIKLWEGYYRQGLLKKMLRKKLGK